jgi:chromosome partitioning protein
MGAKKIAFINSKGGVGKTTSVFNVAGILSMFGEKILIIDLDKQRDSTYTFLMNTFTEDWFTMFDFMKHLAKPEDVVQKSYFKLWGQTKPSYFNVDVMPSDIRFEYQELLKEINMKDALNDFIKKSGYTWVIVDMPPSNKAINDLCFSQIVEHIVVPLSTDINSIRGFGSLIETVEEARKQNSNLNFVGVYLARFSKTRSIHKRIKEQMVNFGDLFIDVCIPDRIDIQEALTYGRPINYYSKNSPSKKAYEKLVAAIQNRIENYEK